MAKNPDDYEVGYGKPPKHSRFPPGVSGRSGRPKKTENYKNMIARVRDEIVEISGKKMTKFEVAVIQVMNQTIKSGKPSDLKVLFELLEKHGALPEADLRAEAEAGAKKVIEKLRDSYLKMHNLNPDDYKLKKAFNREQLEIILSSSDLMAKLRAFWSRADYKDASKRIGKTSLHQEVQWKFSGRSSK